MSDSKELWLSIRTQLRQENFKLGPTATDIFVNDPRMIAFTAARYKFVSKMLSGFRACLEIGCGDGFGAPIVAQGIDKLVCTDIDEESLDENRERMVCFKNIEFDYHDFRKSSFLGEFDGAYLIDVIEHIYPEEEDAFLSNIAASLTPYGTCLIGSPNIHAEKYASKNSKLGHVNLKDHQSLQKLCLQYFHNVFLFSMNDEVVHTGFSPMAHFIWALCVTPKR